jgi:hypothetical protein
MKVTALVRAMGVKAVAIAAFVASPAAAQVAPVRGWEVGEPTAFSWSLMQPADGERTSFESYDLWLWLDDGRYIKLQYVVTSMRAGFLRVANQGSLRATLAPLGQTTDDESGAAEGVFRARRGFSGPDGEWRASSDRFELTFDDCFFRGNDQAFEIALLDDRLKIEATLEMQVPPWQPGDGRTQFGWDSSVTSIEQVLPRFTVTGRVSAKRRKADPENWVSVTGVGYGEHRRTSALPSTVGRRWMGFRAMRSDGLTVVANQMLTADAYGGGELGWALVALDGIPVFASNRLSVRAIDVRTDRSGSSTYQVPYAYRLVAESGEDRVELTFTESALWLRENPLANVSALLRGLLADALAPMDYDLSGRYDGTVRVGGSTATISGRGWSTFSFPR